MKRKFIDLKLTKAELEHIRDLMSVMVVKDRQKTLSILLAEHKSCKDRESRLWKKVQDACKASKIPIGGKEAPDYLIGVITKPQVCVVTMPSDDDS